MTCYRDEDELSAVVREIRRRRHVFWRDWALALVALGMILMVAIF